jgi:protocatechuate 3,4-dioxygenase beta subunit
MLPHRQVSRRGILRGVLISGAAFAIPGLAFAEQCQETPRQDEGPFYLNSYDRTRPVPHSHDLTAVPGASGLPEGEIILVKGQVTDQACRPLKGAMVEIWQANARGRYVHVSDPNPAPKDPNFLGFGEAITDENGMFSFKTIKPGSYPIGPSLIRPPHIHFKVTSGLNLPFITQMYFAGEQYNQSDILLSALAKAEQKRLIIEPAGHPESSKVNLYTFNITMRTFGG